MLYIKVRKKLK